MNGDIITLRNKNTGEIIKLRRKVPEQPIQQLQQEIQQQLPIGEIITPQTFRQQQIEKRIAQRPDIYQEAVGEFQKYPQYLSPEGLRQGGIPLSAIPQTLLKSLGGVAQRAEATVAAPFYEMPRGIPAMARGIKQAITGERKYELGDIARQAGLPEPISAGIGLGLTGGLYKGIAKLLPQKAVQFEKIKTQYGKDIGAGVIRMTSGGAHPQAVRYGMERGWKNIFTKSNLDPEIPTRIAKQVVNNFDDITKNEYMVYGQAMDKVTEGNIRAMDLYNQFQGKLINSGYLDFNGNETAKIKGTIVNKLLKILYNAKENINLDQNLSVSSIQAAKQIIKKMVPSKYWLGKVKSLTEEQRVAKEIANGIDELIGRFGKGMTEANQRYSIFKNIEAIIGNLFTKVEGQKVIPTGQNIINIFDINPTRTAEKLNTLGKVGNYLTSQGYRNFLTPLMDWVTNQEFMTIYSRGAMTESLHPASLLGRSAKAMTRQFLKYMPTSLMGRGIETTGRIAEIAKPYVIPPSILRLITGRNR